MKFYCYTIVIEKEPEDPGYHAFSPDLPGCFGAGATIEETRESMRHAVELYIDGLIAHGRPVPKASRKKKVVHVEELTVGVT